MSRWIHRYAIWTRRVEVSAFHVVCKYLCICVFGSSYAVLYMLTSLSYTMQRTSTNPILLSLAFWAAQ